MLHEAFQRDVEFCRRFYAEALALSRLDHPNLVHVHDFGQEPDGLLYISMAFVDGVTLRAIFKQRERQVLEMPRIASLMLTCFRSAAVSAMRMRPHSSRREAGQRDDCQQKEDDDGERVENVKVLDSWLRRPPERLGRGGPTARRDSRLHVAGAVPR